MRWFTKQPKMRQNKEWTYTGNVTSYLTIIEDFGTWIEFLEESNIEDNDTNKLIYEYLYEVYGYIPLLFESFDLGVLRLKHSIQNKGKKYDILISQYNNNIFKNEDFQELYRYGEKKKTENIDKTSLQYSTTGVETTTVINKDEILKNISLLDDILSMIGKEIILPLKNEWERR